MKEQVVSVVVVVACIVGIVAGATYISSKISCWDFFGLYKGCGVSTIK